MLLQTAVEKFNLVWKDANVKNEELKKPMSSATMQLVRKQIMWGKYDVPISSFKDWEIVLLPELNAVIETEQKR